MTALPDVTHPLDDQIVDDTTRQRFLIEDDGAAAWAMRKLATIRDKITANTRLADDEIARVAAWVADVNTPLERDATYFEALLTEYAIRVRDNEGRKTVSLPFGTVATRATADKVTVDDTTFIPWARDHHPDLLRVKESPDVTALKGMLIPGKPVTVDGELIPGITITPGGITATITTTK